MICHVLLSSGIAVTEPATFKRRSYFTILGVAPNIPLLYERWKELILFSRLNSVRGYNRGWQRYLSLVTPAGRTFRWISGFTDSRIHSSVVSCFRISVDSWLSTQPSPNYHLLSLNFPPKRERVVFQPEGRCFPALRLEYVFSFKGCKFTQWMAIWFGIGR